MSDGGYVMSDEAYDRWKTDSPADPECKVCGDTVYEVDDEGWCKDCEMNHYDTEDEG